MDVDPVEVAGENAGKGNLNARVAVTVALLATFMGVCKVKDDNIVQAMQQAQADQIDNWSWYQARNIREDVAKATAAQLSASAAATDAARRAAFDRAAAQYRAMAAEQALEKAKQRHDATAAKSLYDRLNYRDDQFDLSDAALALAISLLAMTALTQKRWLFGLAMVPTVFGLIMGIAGLLGLPIHPNALAGWLSI